MTNKKNKNKKNIAVVVLILCLIFITIYNVLTMYRNIDIYSNYNAIRTESSTEYEKNVDNSSENQDNIADIIEDKIESVVGISKLKTTGNSILGTAKEDELGLGTGIIITNTGYILSNSHVTGEKYSHCYVTLEDKNTYEGDVVWADKDLDLSIIKIKANNLKYASLGDSDKVRIGDTSFAIGNPIGYEFRRTVTSGIISALNRTIKIEEENNTSYMSNLIQTDATINPGNSGGPLINKKGEVIGINTVKITSAEGIGFAIPINVVKPIIEKLKNNEKFEEATLGIYIYDQDIAQYLSFTNILDKGIYISEVLINGPAYNAGLKEGDIIKTIDGKDLKTINNLREYLYQKNPGDTVSLSVTRGKIARNINVVLGKK